MKKINHVIMIALTAAMVALFVPVVAQQNPDAKSTTEERYDDNDDTNYGWVGLLGLIGLAGLMKRKEVREVRDVNSPKY